MLDTLFTWATWGFIVALGLLLATGLAFIMYSSVAVFLDD